MMNYLKTNRIALLATLLGITYGFLVANTFINDWDNVKRSFVDGFQSASSNSHPAKNEANRNYHLVLSPKEGAFVYPDSLVNLSDHTTLKAINEQVVALGPSTTHLKYSVWYDVFFHLLAIVVFITYIAIPFHFAQLLGRIKKEIVFEKENIRLIRWLGVELLVIYFGNVLVNFIRFKVYASLFRFSHYEVSMHSMDAIWLLFGIAVLLVAEILSKALAMKEEQELTI